MNESQNPVMEVALKAASEGGSCCPKAVAEILWPDLYAEQRGATTYVYWSSPEGTLPIGAAVAKLRETPRLARLFSPDGRLDLRDMPHAEFRAIRKANPELFGLR